MEEIVAKNETYCKLTVVVCGMWGRMPDSPPSEDSMPGPLPFLTPVSSSGVDNKAGSANMEVRNCSRGVATREVQSGQQKLRKLRRGGTPDSPPQSEHARNVTIDLAVC